MNSIMLARTVAAFATNYFGVTSIVFLQRYERETGWIPVQKLLAQSMILTTIRNINDSTINFSNDNMPSIFVVKSCLGSTISAQLPKSPYWLLICNEDAHNMTGLRIPYNYKFLVLFGKSDVFHAAEYFQYSRDAQLTSNNLEISPNGMLDAIPTDIYERRLNFAGAPLSYLITAFDPCHPSHLHGQKLFLCIQFKIWKIFAQMLNATCNPVIIPNVDPVLMKLQFDADKADISINAFFFDSNTMTVVSFVWPTFKSGIDVFTKYQGLEVGWDRYLKPFDSTIWICVLLWLVFSCAVAYLTNRYHSATMKNTSRHESAWAPIYTFLNQGCDSEGKRAWERLLLISLLTVPSILLPSYSAALTSFLAVQVPVMPFTELEGMRYRPEYRLATVDTYPMEVLLQGEDETSKYLLHHALIPKSQRPKNEFEGIRRMCSEPFSYIDTIFSVIATHPPCKYFKLRQPFATYFQSFPIPKKSQYRHIFDLLSRKVRFTGILQKLKYRLSHSDIMLTRIANAPRPELPSISIEDVAILLIILIVGVILALLILAYEILRARMKVGSACLL